MDSKDLYKELEKDNAFSFEYVLIVGDKNGVQDVDISMRKQNIAGGRNCQQCFYADYQYRSFAHCKTQKKADFHTTGKASKRVYILFCFGIFAVFHKGSNGG